MREGWIRVAAVALGAMVVAGSGPAEADQPDVLLLDTEPGSSPLLSRLELTVELGLLDRGTTGVGDPILGLGYDHGGGPLAAVGLRGYWELNEYFDAGLALRLGHQAGGDLGLSGEHGFAWSQLDLAGVFRTELPCMSDDDRMWYLSAFVGVSGVRADAGTGRGPADDRWNERVAASTALDHHALGPLLGLSLDLHSGPWLVGLNVDLREPFALGDGPVSRSFVTTGTLRAGVQLDFTE